MVTEDIKISHQDGWMAIVPTGPKMIVQLIAGQYAKCRFGISSTALGFTLSLDDTIVCDDILYVQGNTYPSSTILSVSRG